METFARGESWSKQEACIELTNHLIVLCNLSFPRVSSLSDIRSQLFVLLFEKITGLVPYDLITDPQNTEHEAHNIQIIIDTLSLDILNISLSHIMGEDIAAGNALSIYNLLEILENFISYPTAVLEELSTTMSEPRVKGKSINTSNECQYIVEPTEQRLDQGKLQRKRHLESTETHVYTYHFPKQDKEASAHESLFLNKICPLCTNSNKGITDLKSEDGKAVREKQREMTLEDSSQSSMTAYQRLPEQLGEPVSLKFLSDGTAVTSSSPPVDEQPEHSVTSNILPEKEIPLSTHSINNLPVKKNVRFVSRKSSRDKKISSESMKRRYEDQNKKYFEERLKNCMEDLESVIESSEFVNNVHGYIFTHPKTSVPKKSAYQSRCTAPKRIRKIHKRRSTRNITEQENLIGDNQFLQELQREFPYIHLSPASIRRMHQQYNHHLRIIGNNLRDAFQRKSRTQIQYEEAERRKAILSEILLKEIAHNERMRLIREQRQNNQRTRTMLRENQESRIHMKQLYDSYQQCIKQKIMRKRTKEERLLTQLYQDGLSIQKEELRELRKQAKEREEKEAEIQRKYLESMENLYQSQFSILAESLAAEKQNFQERAKAQARVLDQMRRDYRRKMEEEVKSLQDQLVQDDDIHFREMDAERIRHMWHKKGICSFFSKSLSRSRKPARQNANHPY